MLCYCEKIVDLKSPTIEDSKHLNKKLEFWIVLSYVRVVAAVEIYASVIV